MSQELLPLLHTLTLLTEEGSVTEDHLLQLCEDQPNFHTSFCRCLDPYQPEISDAAYKWLFLWFSTHITSLRGYALQFIPPLLSTYLSAIYSTAATSGTLKKRCEICLSTLLAHLKEPPCPALSLQNATTSCSLYYYPSTPLDKHTVRVDSLSEGPSPSRHQDSFKPIERINGSTRPILLPLILALFTEELSLATTPVKLSFCTAVTTICSSGIDVPYSSYLSYSLDKQEHTAVTVSQLNSLQQRQRIGVTEDLLIEMCHGLRFCLNRSALLASLQAAECVYFRSLLESRSRAMLCSNALLNILTEELQEEINDFERSSLENSLSTPVKDTSGINLGFDTSNESTAV